MAKKATTTKKKPATETTAKKRKLTKEELEKVSGGRSTPRGMGWIMSKGGGDNDSPFS